MVAQRRWNVSDFHKMIIYWHENVSTKHDFLFARSRAEAAARNMLDEKAGWFTANDFQLFFQHCNTERVPPHRHTLELNDHETHTRLRPAFMGNNQKRMLESSDKLNQWTRDLWKNKDPSLKIFEQFWSHSNVKGAGISFPSMIMYLKNPDHYAIWLPFLTDALSKFANQRVPKRGSLENYFDFNSAVDRNLRKPFDLQPQEIDYILFCIGKRSEG